MNTNRKDRMIRELQAEPATKFFGHLVSLVGTEPKRGNGPSSGGMFSQFRLFRK